MQEVMKKQSASEICRFNKIKPCNTARFLNDEENYIEPNEHQDQSRIGIKYFNFLPDVHEFCWDPDNSSKEINFSSDCRHAFLHETNYLFRTMISNRPFMDGVHYWELIADSRTEHELKIGVTT
jgi:hypothetical protein